MGGRDDGREGGKGGERRVLARGREKEQVRGRERGGKKSLSFAHSTYGLIKDFKWTNYLFSCRNIKWLKCCYPFIYAVKMFTCDGE